MAHPDVFANGPEARRSRRFIRASEQAGTSAVVAPAATRVAILGDQPVVAEALEWMLRAAGEFEIDAVHRDPGALLRDLLAGPPDVVLVDTRIVAQAGAFAFVADVRARAVPVKVVVLIDQVDHQVMRLVMDLHVDGLVLKSSSSQEILGAVRQVVAGHAVFPAEWHAALSGVGREAPVRSLSQRQLEVLKLAADGCPNEEIAVRLDISVNTVKSHLRTIFVRIGARNRVEAARILAHLDVPRTGP